MNRQERMAIINDYTGFGRCSVAVSLPIISAMGIECCPLPTTILSAHMAYSNVHVHDFTKDMLPYMNHWKELGVTFDGICTGFLGSIKQIEQMISFFQLFKTKDNMVFVDPVMGDNGHLYQSYTKQMCQEMKQLLPYSDVLMPNLTEACELLDLNYPDHPLEDDEIEPLLQQLSNMGPKYVVITGVPQGDFLCNYALKQGYPMEIIRGKKIGPQRCGTGDVFSAIVSGRMVQGDDFYQAITEAVVYIEEAVTYSLALGTPLKEGICFEPFLWKLHR